MFKIRLNFFTSRSLLKLVVKNYSVR